MRPSHQQSSVIVSLLAVVVTAIWMGLAAPGVGAQATGAQLISEAPDGTAGNGDSSIPNLSASGRIIVFVSNSTNLAPNAPKTTAFTDLFISERHEQTRSIIRVLAGGGAEPNGNTFAGNPTPSGRFVVFNSIASNYIAGVSGLQVYKLDRSTNAISLVSAANGGSTPGNGFSFGIGISSDGRFVAFSGNSTNLVSASNNGVLQVYLRDTATNTTTLVSVATDGTSASNGFAGSSDASISANGQLVAFDSDASNLVAGVGNSFTQVYVRNIASGTTAVASVDNSGNLANGGTVRSWISPDGNFVVFSSVSKNLVAGDTTGIFAEVFMRNLSANQTTRISLASDGSQPNDSSDIALNVISANDRFVTFTSFASNLVPGDTNGVQDIFVRDVTLSATARADIAPDGLQAAAGSANNADAISANGRLVGFTSAATNFPGANGHLQVYVAPNPLGP